MENERILAVIKEKPLLDIYCDRYLEVFKTGG